VKNSRQKIKVIFLGTNGWYDTKTGNTICVLIDAPEAYIVLDAGTGLYKLDQYIKDRKKPIYLFLSHFHLDHLIGLHTMAKFRFKQGLTIVGQKGTKRILSQLVRQPFTLALKDLKTKVKVRELGSRRLCPFLEAALKLDHVSSCYGFRLNFGGKIIAYIADTGECKNAYKLAAGADLVISECAFKNGNRLSQWPHLDPKSAARIAAVSGAKKLALAHFDAAIYTTLSERITAGKKARSIFRNSVTAKDGLTIDV